MSEVKTLDVYGAVKDYLFNEIPFRSGLRDHLSEKLHLHFCEGESYDLRNVNDYLAHYSNLVINNVYDLPYDLKVKTTRYNEKIFLETKQRGYPEMGDLRHNDYSYKANTDLRLNCESKRELKNHIRDTLVSWITDIVEETLTRFNR